MQNKANLNLLSQMISKTSLDAAFDWDKKKNLKASAEHSIWHLSYNWPKTRSKIRQFLLQDQYQLSPLTSYQTSSGKISCWTSKDAIVLKMLQMNLEDYLKDKIDLSAASHLKGNGGLKGAVRKAKDLASKKQWKYIFKTDIANFYKNISHHVLDEQLCVLIPDIQRLLRQYCNRVEIQDGNYIRIENRGIPQGGSLSPPWGAIYLQSLDAYEKSME